jgi:Virulence factor
MTRVQVVYWRDIPAQVKARQGAERVSRPLSDRFQVAIDESAMSAGLSGTDAYLGEWRSSEGQERPEPPDAAAETVAKELEAAYPASRLTALVAGGGVESPISNL